MHMRSSRSLMRPAYRAKDQAADYLSERPKSSIAGIILLGLLVAIGIWAWPELHRTIHIHRM